MANLIPLLLQEIEQEASSTRKMLTLVPDDKHDWKPHEKSMSMKQLAVHIAEIPEWVQLAVETESIDFAKGYAPTPCNNNAELMGIFENALKSGIEALGKANDELLINGTWSMHMGDHHIATLSKYETVRHSISQTIHHRAQLGVYLRLLNIPIPGTYGPSADDSMGF
jgi:uncharacterized damage-inducible protein DinB